MTISGSTGSLLTSFCRRVSLDITLTIRFCNLHMITEQARAISHPHAKRKLAHLQYHVGTKYFSCRVYRGCLAELPRKFSVRPVTPCSVFGWTRLNRCIRVLELSSRERANTWSRCGSAVEFRMDFNWVRVVLSLL